MKKLVAVGAVIAAVAFGAIAVAETAWQGGKNCGKGCKEECFGPGERGPGRMYDPAKAETVKGQIEAVEQISGRRGMGQGVVLTVRTDAGTLNVHMGPQWYMEQQSEMKLKAGDDVEIKGVKARRGDQDIFIAGEIKRGDAVLKLRDDNGIPLWAGARRGGCKGPGRCQGNQS